MNKMLHRILQTVLVFCFILATFSGCTSDPDEVIELPAHLHEVDGVCYLDPDSLPSTSKSPDGVQVEAGFYVDSLKELQDLLISGNFTKSQAQTIVDAFPSVQEGIEVPNPYRLYQPTLPKDCNLLNEVYWTIDGYTFSFNDTNGELSGTVQYYQKQYYPAQYQHAVEGETASGGPWEETTIHGLPAQAHERTALSGGRTRSVKYDLKNNQGDVLHIVEDYVLESDSLIPETTVSEEFPHFVSIYCEQSDGDGGVEICFYGKDSTHFQHELSVEWLKSFGIEKFKG